MRELVQRDRERRERERVRIEGRLQGLNQQLEQERKRLMAVEERVRRQRQPLVVGPVTFLNIGNFYNKNGVMHSSTWVLNLKEEDEFQILWYNIVLATHNTQLGQMSIVLVRAIINCPDEGKHQWGKREYKGGRRSCI